MTKFICRVTYPQCQVGKTKQQHVLEKPQKRRTRTSETEEHKNSDIYWILSGELAARLVWQLDSEMALSESHLPKFMSLFGPVPH